MRKLKLTNILLLQFFCCLSMAQTSFTISGNSDWQFRLAKDAAEGDALVAEGFYTPDNAAEGFTNVYVPSNWAVQGFEEPVYRGFSDKTQQGNSGDDVASEGFYRHSFTLPQSFGGKRILLHFGGVWNSAEVWLNGKRLGRHDSGYTSFSFDVTGNAKVGQNVLAVRVRQVYPGYKADTFDDWTLGGIYRDVTLQCMPKRRWIDRVTAITDFDAAYRNASLKLKMMIADDHKNTLPGNYRSPGEPYKLHVTLTDSEGNVACDETYDCASHTANYREQQKVLTIRDARKWTAETPYLYNMKVELIETDGSVAQTYEERIGLRKVEIKDGVLCLNGQPIKLRGVNRHDEWPTVGRATTREHWLKDLELMKQANINYIRAAHYQHAKGFIQMCDSIGMYVGSEVSLGGAGTMMFDPAFVAPVMLRTYETVMRDLNNPSIIYWSVGNEDPFTDLHLQAVKTVKALDGTRPVCLPWDADETLPEEVDILAPHYWTAHEYDSIASRSHRPIITTEYVHAYGEMRFGGLEDCFRALTKHPAGAGGAVWMWADQGIYSPVPKDTKRYKSIEKDSLYLRIDAQGWDGITDSYRHPMRDYWEVKAVYCPITIEHSPLIIATSFSQFARDPFGVDHYNNAQPNSQFSILNFQFANAYDFLTTEGMTVDYRIFVDGRQTAKGSMPIGNIAPHSTGTITITKTGIKSLKPGQTAYAQFFIKDSSGFEIGRKSLVLAEKPHTSPLPTSPKGEGTATVASPIIVDESAPTAVTVSDGSPVGESAIPSQTQPATNLKFSILNFQFTNGMPAGIRPTFWHKMNEGDLIIKERLNDEKWLLKNATVSREEKDGKAIVTTRALYAANDSNRVEGTYTFTISPDGTMEVSYAMTPTITGKSLPIIGMAIEALPKQWLGLGPEDAYPNKKAAPILGRYDARQWSGTRAARWIDTSIGRIILKPSIGDYAYIDRDDSDSPELRILGHVLGRSEKGRLNDERYKIATGHTYSGSFTIRK